MTNLKVLIRIANHTERLLDDVQEIFIFNPIRITDIPLNSTPSHTPEPEPSDTEQTKTEPPSIIQGSLVTNLFTTSHPAPQLGREFTRETYLNSVSSDFEDPHYYWSREIEEQNQSLPPVTPVNQRIQEQHTPPLPPVKPEIRRPGTPIPPLGSPIYLNTPTPGPSRLRNQIRRIRRRISDGLSQPIRQPGESRHPKN